MKNKKGFLRNFAKSLTPTSNIKRLWLMVIILLSSLLGGSGLGAAPLVEQSAESLWSEPINLSRSGAASEPALFHSEAGGWQVFWMDQFDGLTSTRRSAGEWGAPVTTPLFVSRVAPSGEVTRLPVQEMPDLWVDSQGTVHALWLGTLEEGQEAQLVPTEALYYSEYPIGATAWPEPLVIARSALAWDLVEDAAGQLQLAYIRPTQNEEGSAGVYYHRRSIGGDPFWVDGQLLYENIYFRRLEKEQATIDVTSDEGLNLLATWNNPEVQTSFYAQRANGEQTWSSPEEIGTLPRGAKNAQVVTGSPGEVLRLWQAVDSSCALYQQRSTDGGVSWGEEVEVLEDLNSCPASWRLLRHVISTNEGFDSGTLLWIGGEDSNNLTLAAWNGSQWSAPKPLTLPTETKEGSLTLNALQVGVTGQTMAVVGQDENGDIWFMESQEVLEDWLFAEPSPWLPPLNLYPVQNNQDDDEDDGLLGLPGLPTIATDKNGNVHILWSEALAPQMPGTALFYVRWTGSRWTKPLEVLRAAGNTSFLARSESFGSVQFSPDSEVSKAEQPALIAVGERLHAVWSGGYSGEVYYGRAKIDNTAPSEWSEPQPLYDGPEKEAAPSSGCCPTIVADAWQRLHVVVAVPLNEGRGLYYTRSDDGGETWLSQGMIFNAEAAGWAQVSHPRLAVDQQGIIHLLWVREELPGNFPFKSIYYARSTNGGEEWSKPLQLAAGAYNWPLIASNNNDQLHVVWQEASNLSSSQVTLGWHHRHSQDSGLNWARAKQIPGFTGVSGPASLSANGAGTLYLAGMSQEPAGRSKLQLLLWNDGGWTSPTFFDFNLSSQPGIAIALQPELGKLDVAFRAKEDEKQDAVWTTSQTIPPVELTPAPTFTPSPTTMPSPPPTLTPEPTATPALSSEPGPDSTGQSTSLMLSALLAGLAIGSILVVRFVRK